MLEDHTWRIESGGLSLGKAEDEESFQDVLAHRTEAAVGQDTKFVGGDHVLSGGIKVAWHITAVVALGVCRRTQPRGRFRNVRACEKSGKICNFAVDHVDIEASGFERGDIETDDVVIIRRAISE